MHFALGCLPQDIHGWRDPRRSAEHQNAETGRRAARALQADYRMALTGTHVENTVGDIWSIMEFLNPGFLGSQAEFKRKFFIPIQANRDPDAADRLKRVTRPFILRRL
jgi:SNF2 family DNA or RNA helicase